MLILPRGAPDQIGSRLRAVDGEFFAPGGNWSVMRPTIEACSLWASCDKPTAAYRCASRFPKFPLRVLLRQCLSNEVANDLRCVSTSEGQGQARNGGIPLELSVDDAGHLKLAHRRRYDGKAQLCCNKINDGTDLWRGLPKSWLKARLPAGLDHSVEQSRPNVSRRKNKSIAP